MDFGLHAALVIPECRHLPRRHTVNFAEEAAEKVVPRSWRIRRLTRLLFDLRIFCFLALILIRIFDLNLSCSPLLKPLFKTGWFGKLWEALSLQRFQIMSKMPAFVPHSPSRKSIYKIYYTFIKLVYGCCFMSRAAEVLVF